MKKTTKGALAAGSAAVLLMGGVGTLAYWTDEATVDGTEINSGYLKLINEDCGIDGWVLDAGTAQEAPFVAQLLVPGDTLTKTCTYEIDAVGDHLEATLEVDSGTGLTGDAGLLEELDTAASTISVAGAPYTTGAVDVVDADEVEVAFVVTWPFNDAIEEPADGDADPKVDNGSNSRAGLQAVLDDVAVTLTQVDTH